MHIDELFNQLSTDDASTQFNDLLIPSDWSQGRTVYGGLTAALQFVAAQQSIDTGRQLRSLSCNFVGPLLVETPLQVSVQHLRNGKNVSQIMTTVTQGEHTCAISQMSFGVSRPSKVSVENQQSHAMPEPEKPKFIPMIPKVVPKFLQHFDFNLHAGRFPFAGSKSSHLHGWMRFKKPPAVFTTAHLIASIDAWPPTVLQMLRLPAPASTMSWSLEFIHPMPAISSSDWLAYQVNTRHAADGYCHTEGNVWGEGNRLLALSRQTVTVFD